MSISEKPMEKAGVIGDNAVDAGLCEAPHVGGSVDGPHEHSLAGSSDLAYQGRVSELVMRNHILDRERAPKAEFGLRLADQAQGDCGIFGMDRPQHFWQKR